MLVLSRCVIGLFAFATIVAKYFCVAAYLAECDEVHLILYTSSRFTVAICLVAFPALLLLRLLILARSGRFVLLVSKLSNHIRAQPAARPPWRLICGGLRDSSTH